MSDSEQALSTVTVATESIKRLLKLLDQVERNTVIIQGMSSNILKILETKSLVDLLNLLAKTPLATKQPTAVRLVLNDPKHEIRNLLSLQSVRSDKIHNLAFLEDFKEFEHRARPWLGPYSEPDHEKFFGSDSGLESIAILPLRRSKALIGLLIWGSSDASRFTSDHADDFLVYFSLVASVSIENLINKDRLQWQSITDALTGWFNRRHLERSLIENVRHAAQCRQPVSCVMFDLDHFKSINDTYGHDAGDQILREVTHRVKAQTRPTDICARYGGEEFVVIFPRMPSIDAREVGEKIRAAVDNDEFCAGDQTISVSVSVGISTFDPKSSERYELAAKSLLKSADDALYAAKGQGRNCVVVS